ncbi:hypothetical protein HanRHA438_Chr12g0554111 [Helianthus annuus]|nr:hypothetical protein HanRHA438_Chr12g0554111 [Helianthus annuus]
MFLEKRLDLLERKVFRSTQPLLDTPSIYDKVRIIIVAKCSVQPNTGPARIWHTKYLWSWKFFEEKELCSTQPSPTHI